MFECYVVVWCRAKNEYQKDMCLKDTRSCVQNMTAIQDSIIYLIGWGWGGYIYDHLMTMRIVT